MTTWRNGVRLDISAEELLALEEIMIPAWIAPEAGSSRASRPMKCHPRDVDSIAPIVSVVDVPGFCQDRFLEMVNRMNLIGAAAKKEDLWLFHFSATKANADIYRAHGESHGWVAPIELKQAAGLRCDFLGEVRSQFYVLAREHPVTRWLAHLRESSRANPLTIKPEYVEMLWRTAATEWFNLDDLLAKWANDPKVPTEFKPPTEKNSGLTRFNCTSLISRTTVSAD